jgi:uncharacterized protein YwgA
MDSINIILTLLSIDKEPIRGTTRFQKLIFLLEKEESIIPDDIKFDFEGYLYGPHSKKLKDDIEFLVNLGFIEKSNYKDEIKNYSIENINSFSVSDFMPSDKLNYSNVDFIDDDNERDDVTLYRITQKGIVHLKNNTQQEQLFDSITYMKHKYNNLPLVELLRYVYTKYPEYTSESIIKDELLG